MSEICGVCGEANCYTLIDPRMRAASSPQQFRHWRLGYERTLARADRYEAEFSACKALLIAAEGRAEEAERRAREACRLTAHDGCDSDCAMKDAWEKVEAAEQRASEARAALEGSQRQAEAVIAERWDGKVAPEYPRAYGMLSSGVQIAIRALAALPVETGAARSASEPAPQSKLNPPPSPTGDAE